MGEKKIIGMTRDEWQKYCNLSASGDPEALREYIALEQKQKDKDKKDV